jgi:YidC/Oxa1 family membrane protein insertase
LVLSARAASLALLVAALTALAPATSAFAQSDTDASEGTAGAPENGAAQLAPAQPSADEPGAGQPAAAPAIDLGMVVKGQFTDPAFEPIGSLDYTAPDQYNPQTDYHLYLEPSHWGAGLDRVTLTRHFDDVSDLVAANQQPGAAESQYVIQDKVDNATDMQMMSGRRLRSAAAVVLFVQIPGQDEQALPLFGSSALGRVWERAPDPHSHRYIAEIATEGGAGEVVLRVVREYQLEPGSYSVIVRQRVVNMWDRPLGVRLVQDGPINLQQDTSGYRLELRRVRTAWIEPNTGGTTGEPADIKADGKLRTLQWVVTRDETAATPGANKPDHDRLWPAQDVWGTPSGRLSWTAQTDRFFAGAVHALGEQTASPIAGGSSVVSPVLDPHQLPFADAVRAESVFAPAPNVPWTLMHRDSPRRLALRFRSVTHQLAPDEELNLDFALYFGPLDASALEEQTAPAVGLVRLAEVVVYNIGGPCAFCTFPLLGRGLLWILSLFHGFTGDWAISIILLVIVVRTALHPITKKSQVGLLRFGKQMQRLAPKQKAIQEKYKNDPVKLRQEVTKLMREEGVNPAGALGCLPMFLQTPIWIALYAMLFMKFDLRHEAGFYGVFQSLTGGSWEFLADLSRGDHFIPLPSALHFGLPLMGEITAFNVIPILMGVLFYVQQKYMTPPPSTEISPEMQTQQKLMKVMLVVMMPVIMYNAPAALTLYFMTNSVLGILESRYIRSHVDQLELELEEHGVKTVRQLKKKKAATRMGAAPLSEKKHFKKRK